MDNSTFAVWFVTWLSLSGLLCIALICANLIHEFRQLRSQEFPKPAFILKRRFLNLLPTLRRQKESALVGRKAWIAWDIRWLASGQTMAFITGQGEAGKLELELAEPIHILAVPSAPEVLLRNVRFVPQISSMARYESTAVNGALEPALSDGCIVKAEIVVYPLGA